MSDTVRKDFDLGLIGNVPVKITVEYGSASAGAALPPTTSLASYQQTAMSQVTLNIPESLHQMARDLTYEHRYLIQTHGSNPAVLYIALLELLRADPETRQKLEQYFKRG
jgi:hypothetical protein